MTPSSRRMLAVAVPLVIVLALALPVVVPQTVIENQVEARQSSGQESKRTSMTINIVVDGTPIKAVLEDNPTSRDFVALLPMTVQIEDFAGREKIGHLAPRRLSTQGRTPDYSAEVWDITYYVPWGNIAIFYKSYEPSRDLIKMGRIVSGQRALMRDGSFSARIERAD